MNKDYYELEELFKQCEEATQDLMLRMRALRDKMEEMKPSKVEKVIYEQYKTEDYIPGLITDLRLLFDLHDIEMFEGYTVKKFYNKNILCIDDYRIINQFVTGICANTIILTIIPSKKLIIIAEV